jgi:leader peptidase (prepilin peptidase)/N-methyltransferase
MGVGAAVVLIVWMLALSGYDIRQRRLPNALTLPGAAVVLVVATVAGRGWPAAVGAAALAVVYLAVHVAMPAGLGAGDVKLALGVGALTGAFGVDAWVLAALTAPLLTALWGVAVVVAGRIAAVRDGQAAAVPHGPSMCLSALAAVALVIG